MIASLNPCKALWGIYYSVSVKIRALSCREINILHRGLEPVQTIVLSYSLVSFKMLFTPFGKCKSFDDLHRESCFFLTYENLINFVLPSCPQRTYITEFSPVIAVFQPCSANKFSEACPHADSTVHPTCTFYLQVDIIKFVFSSFTSDFITES